MKAILFWASAALAQGLRQATETAEGAESTPVPWYPSPEEEVSECTANVVAKLCDYKKPISGTAVASSGPKNCWEYCDEHQPCGFVIFVAGNPYTGTGTCWVYPGEEFDPTLGEEGCDHLTVFDKPVCPTPTPTDGATACAATESPSHVAAVCDYPPPESPCFYNCTASSGAVDCLSQCVQADSCAYAVFNPGNPAMSPYYSGGCYLYETGSYDETKARKCDEPEQYVYKNPCPKPPKPSTTKASSATSTASGGSSEDSSDDDSSSDDNDSSNGGSSNGGSSNGGSSGSGSSSNGSSGSGSSDGGNSSNDSSSSGDESNGSPSNAEAQGATNGEKGDEDKSGSASLSVSLGGLLAAALVASTW